MRNREIPVEAVIVRDSGIAWSVPTDIGIQAAGRLPTKP